MNEFWQGIDTGTPVVVAYRGGQAAVSVARTLGRLGVRVALVAGKHEAPAVASSRFWHRRYWWDFAAPAQESVQFLKDVAADLGGRPVLLTLADWMAIFIERHARELSEAFTFPASGQPFVHRLSDKWEMYRLASELGIDTPRTIRPRSIDEVQAFLEVTGFPVVAKPADAFSAHVPCKGILRSRTEVLMKFERAAERGNPNMVLQEYVPGTALDVWMCNAYFDRESRCKFIASGRKLRQVDESGIASLAAVQPNEEVERATQRFMQGANYAGAVGIGYRYDARDGRYKVLDVNPRVSGVFRLFSSTSDMDAVRAAYLDLTGQAVPASEPSAGRKWLLEDDLFSAWRAARSGELGLRQWMASLRGTRELHWFAGDDPMPGLTWLWQSIRPRLRAG